MKNYLETLSHLPALPIQQVLDIVLQISRDYRLDPGIELPEISVYLSDGQCHRGYLLPGGEEAGSPNLALLSKQPGENMDICYFSKALITSLVVHEIPRFAHYFPLGAIAIPPQYTAPSLAELSHTITKMTKQYREAQGIDITLKADLEYYGDTEDTPRYFLGQALNALHRALLRYWQDDKAAKIFREKIKKVRLLTATDKAVHREEEELQIAQNLFTTPVLYFTSDELISHFQELFLLPE